MAYAILGVLALLALVSLARPFVGLLALVAVYYIQPSELFPLLSTIHVERIFGLFVLLGYVLASKDRTKIPWRNPVIMGVVVLLGISTLGIPFALWKANALRWTLELIKLLVYMFLVATLVNSESRMRKLLWLETVLLTWTAGTALYAFAHGQYQLSQNTMRAMGLTSLTGGPNELASMIAVTLPMIFPLFSPYRKFVVRIALLAVLGVTVTGLVLTGSRNGLFQLVGLILYCILRSRHKVVGFSVLCVLLLAAWTIMPEQYQRRYLTTAKFAEGEKLDSSNELRLAVWRTGTKIFFDHPILGVGAGNFAFAYSIYTNSPAWFEPHSLFYQVACEFGVVGLAGFLYFLIALAKQNALVRRLAVARASAFCRLVTVACGASIVATLIDSATGHTFYRPFWYFIAGVIVANQHVVAKVYTEPAGARLQVSPAKQPEVAAWSYAPSYTPEPAP